MDATIHRCASGDGTPIAFRSFGSGLPLLLAISWATTIEAQLPNAHSAPFYKRLGAARRIVMFDRRGVGASGRDPADPSMPAQLADVRAVAGALGIDVTELLPRIGAPALVASTRHDGPRSVGVASLIKDGRFVAIDPPEGKDEMDLSALARNIIGFLDAD